MEGVEAALLPLGLLKLPHGCCAGHGQPELPAGPHVKLRSACAHFLDWQGQSVPRVGNVASRFGLKSAPPAPLLREPRGQNMDGGFVSIKGGGT